MVSDPFVKLSSFLFHLNRFCAELWFTMLLKVLVYLIMVRGPPLMGFILSVDQALMCGIVLLCYLTLNVGNSEALEQVWTSNSLEGTACSVAQQT